MDLRFLCSSKNPYDCSSFGHVSASVHWYSCHTSRRPESRESSGGKHSSDTCQSISSPTELEISSQTYWPFLNTSKRSGLFMLRSIDLTWIHLLLTHLLDLVGPTTLSGPRSISEGWVPEPVVSISNPHCPCRKRTRVPTLSVMPCGDWTNNLNHEPELSTVM